VVGNKLDSSTILLDLSCSVEFIIFSLFDLSEPNVLTNHNLLLSGEFELSSSEGFDGVFNVSFLDSAREQHLIDSDSGDLSLGLTEGSSHTSLESISTCAGKHLIDTKSVPGMNSASQMEAFLTAFFDEVFVDGNTTGFKGFRGDLFLFE